MRDLDTIDSELRLLAAVRWSIREHGGEPSSRQVDALLDERRELYFETAFSSARAWSPRAVPLMC